MNTVAGSGPGGSGGGSLKVINQAALGLLAVFAVQGVFSALRSYLFTVAGERVVARLRRDLYSSLLRQEIAFFDEQRTGELTNRLAADTTVLQNAVTANLSMLLRFGLTPLYLRYADVVEAELLRLENRLPGLDDGQRDQLVRRSALRRPRIRVHERRHPHRRGHQRQRHRARRPHQPRLPHARRTVGAAAALVLRVAQRSRSRPLALYAAMGSDRAEVATLFGVDARIRPRCIDESQHRNAELFGQAHQPQGLAHRFVAACHGSRFLAPAMAQVGARPDAVTFPLRCGGVGAEVLVGGVGHLALLALERDGDDLILEVAGRGGALGAVVAGVRVLLGFDQPYLDR